MREAAASDRALMGVQFGEKMTMLYRSMNACTSFVDLPDRDLLREVKRLAQVERDATAAIVASLGEADARERSAFPLDRRSARLRRCDPHDHLPAGAPPDRCERSQRPRIGTAQATASRETWPHASTAPMPVATIRVGYAPTVVALAPTAPGRTMIEAALGPQKTGGAPAKATAPDR
jgi:hypothetical protein